MGPSMGRGMGGGMARFSTWLNGIVTTGPLGRLLRSRYYVPLATLTLVVLTVGAAAGLLVRYGALTLPFAQTHSSIVITGPGVSDDPQQIQAYALGAVTTPGVYALAPGARVHDLVDAAGGPTSDADLSTVALAAPLGDGQTVYVPHTGETPPLLLGGKVDLNTANEAQLHSALGISLEIARRIVAYRVAHGQFTAISQLLLVPVSRTTYDHIKDLVTV